MLVSPLVPLVGVLVQGKLHLLSSLRPALTHRDHWELGIIHSQTHEHTKEELRIQRKGAHMWVCDTTFIWSVINTVYYMSASHTPLKLWDRFESMSSPNSNRRLTALLSIHHSHRWEGKESRLRSELNIQTQCAGRENKVKSDSVPSYTKDQSGVTKLCKMEIHKAAYTVCWPNHLPLWSFIHWLEGEAALSLKS